MKTELRLSQLSGLLPDVVQEALASHDVGEVVLRRLFPAKAEAVTVAQAERSVVRYVSTRDLDREKEILDPDGADLSQFKLAPQVLWGHNYSLPPIGSDTWINSDGYGLMAKTVYATTERAEEVWTLVREGHLRTSSVGFLPLEFVEKDGPGWAETTKRYDAKWGNDRPNWGDVNRLYTKWLLLEHSDVAVPANPHALTVAVAGKGLNLSTAMIEELGVTADAEPQPKAIEVPGLIVPQIRLHPKVGPIVRPVVIAHPRAPRRVSLDEIIREELLRAQGRP